MITKTFWIGLAILFRVSEQLADGNQGFILSEDGLVATVYKTYSTTTTCATSESSGNARSSPLPVSSSSVYVGPPFAGSSSSSFSSTPILPSPILNSPSYLATSVCIQSPSIVTVYNTVYAPFQVSETRYSSNPPITVTVTASSGAGYDNSIITQTIPGPISTQTTTLSPSFMCQAGTTYVTNFNYGNCTSTAATNSPKPLGFDTSVSCPSCTSCPSSVASSTLAITTISCTTPATLQTNTPNCSKTEQRDYLINFIIFLILFIIFLILFLVMFAKWWRLRR